MWFEKYPCIKNMFSKNMNIQKNIGMLIVESSHLGMCRHYSCYSSFVSVNSFNFSSDLFIKFVLVECFNCCRPKNVSLHSSDGTAEKWVLLQKV